MKPFTVTLAGKKVPVKFKPMKSHEWGEFDHSEQVIYLNPDKPKHELESTLFHELIHAAFWFSGVTNVLNDQTEEAVAHCLENLLAPLYKRK